MESRRCSSDEFSAAGNIDIDVDFNFINLASKSVVETQLNSGLDAPDSVVGDMLLVVDDNLAVLDTLMRALKASGFSLISATTGGWALKLFQQHFERIPVVILDDCLPDIAGQDLIKQLHGICARTKVILVSGYYGDDGHPPRLDSRYAVFIHKPFRLSTLFNQINKFLCGGEDQNSTRI